MGKPTPAVPMWLGKHPLLHPDHETDVETRAAAHEFRHRLPRPEAEARAYHDYLVEQALDAAAHHLVHLRGAHAAGQDPAARQHGEAYAAAMRAAGHDPLRPPPKEVHDRARALGGDLYSFKPHAADGLWTPAADGPDPALTQIREQIAKLKTLSGRFEALGDDDAGEAQS